jgi:predicted dehydrogenase
MTESCLIIGLGQVGMGYDYKKNNNKLILTHANAINKHPEFNLIGGVDLSSEKRENFEKLYNKLTFSDLDLALEKLKPTLVVIATPTETHSSVLAKVIKLSKPKIILCEKPLSYDFNSAKNIVKMCNQADIKLFVNYMRSVDVGALEIKRRIEAGEIEYPIKANVWYSKGLFNNGSHFLNLLNFWLGDTVSIKLLKLERFYSKLDPEPDFKVEFRGGTAIFRSGWEEAFSHHSIEFICSTGRLLYDYGGKSIEWHAVIDDKDFSGYKILTRKKEVISNSMSIYQMEVYNNIFKYLKNNKTTLTTGSQALDTLKSLNLIIEQIKKND